MTRLERHTRSLRRRIPRALRWLAVCVLAGSMADVVATAQHCLEAVEGCDGTCAMCLCKRDASTTRMRTACGCCRTQPGMSGSLTDIGPALVPRPAVSDAVFPVTTAAPGGVVRPPSFSPSVPHPPPRFV